MAVTEKIHEPIKKITYEWTSDAAGDAELETAQAYTGTIERLVTVPGTGGDQPTNLYDVEIQDEDDVDVLMGAGEDRSNTGTEQASAGDLGIVGYSTLTLVVANAGDGNTGTVHLYVR